MHGIAATNRRSSPSKGSFIFAMTMPHETGALVENESLPDKEVRRVPIDNFILYYKPIPAEQTVYIVRIVYGYRNLDAILRTIE